MSSNLSVFTGMARALIVKDDKVLLCRYDDKDAWKTPGGRIDAIDATPADTCRREVRERLGYGCDIGPVADIEFVEYKGHKGFWIVYVCSLGKREEEKDDVQTKWFSKKEVKQLLDDKKVEDHDVKSFQLFVTDKLPDKSR